MLWKKCALRELYKLSKRPLTKEQEELRNYAEHLPKAKLDSLILNCYSKASENLVKSFKE